MRYLAAPAGEAELRRTLAELKLGTRLAGFRGEPRADADAFVAAALRLGALAATPGFAGVEIELNPVFIRREGEGVVAADISPGCAAAGIGRTFRATAATVRN